MSRASSLSRNLGLENTAIHPNSEGTPERSTGIAVTGLDPVPAIPFEKCLCGKGTPRVSPAYDISAYATTTRAWHANPASRGYDMAYLDVGHGRRWSASMAHSAISASGGASLILSTRRPGGAPRR